VNPTKSFVGFTTLRQKRKSQRCPTIDIFRKLLFRLTVPDEDSQRFNILCEGFLSLEGSENTSGILLFLVS